MDIIICVKAAKCFKYLMENSRCISFLEVWLSNDVIEKLTTIHDFLCKVYLLIILKCIIDFQNIWMLYLCQNLYLVCHLLNLRLANQMFVNNSNRSLLVRFFMQNFTKIAMLPKQWILIYFIFIWHLKRSSHLTFCEFLLWCQCFLPLQCVLQGSPFIFFSHLLESTAAPCHQGG